MQNATSVLTLLNNAFTMAIRRAYPATAVTNIVKHTDQPRFGDYQCSASMAIASVSLTQSHQVCNCISCLI